MVHHRQSVHLDSLHPLGPQPARHVLQAIDALVMEVLHQRAALMGNTPTRPRRRDAIFVKQAESVQMAIDQCHVQLATSVNMDSLTARHVSQETTVLLVHLIVSHVQQENSVLVLLLSQ